MCLSIWFCLSLSSVSPVSISLWLLLHVCLSVSLSLSSSHPHGLCCLPAPLLCMTLSACVGVGGYMWGSVCLCWGRVLLFCCLAPVCLCALPLQVHVSVGLSFSPSRSSSLSSSRKLRKKEEATLLEADWLLVTSLFSRERAKITEYFWSRAQCCPHLPEAPAGFPTLPDLL